MAENADSRTSFDNTAWVTYVNPFVIIRKDSEPAYSLSLDQINANTYDHGKLCEIVAALRLDAIDPLAALVCFDGAIAIPSSREVPDADTALEYFNYLLCSLLLGGILCEAVDRRDVALGHLYQSRLIWPVDLGKSLNSHVHCQLRMRAASTLDIIKLADPTNVEVSRFHSAFNQGAFVLRSLPGLTPTFLLRGFTELRYHNFSDALANLWIVAEQLTSAMWSSQFLSVPDLHPTQLKARRESLTNDGRTWSISVRQEILFQLGAIDEHSFASFFTARKARNELVHSGKSPHPDVVINLYRGLMNTIQRLTNSTNLGINELDLQQEGHPNSDPDQNFEEWEIVSKSFRVT